MRTVLLSFSICLILLSCRKKTSEKNASQPCGIATDSAAIAAKLPGSWILTKYSCQAGKEIMADKNIRVEFDANGAYTVQEDTTVIAQGTWTLAPVPTDQWNLDLHPTNYYISGLIFSCTDQEIEFDDSWVDGCANYYQRAN